MGGAPAWAQGREDRAPLSLGWWEPREIRSQNCWLPALPPRSQAALAGLLLLSLRLGKVMRTSAVWLESSLSSSCLLSSSPRLVLGLW